MNIIFYVIILLLFYFITNTEHFEPLYKTSINSSYITNNITKCCLVEKKYLSNKKELHGGNFKYVYTKKTNEECNNDLYNLNSNKQLLFDGVNNWSNKYCNNKSNVLLGSCRNINKECVDFVDKKFCDNYRMKWSSKTCHEPLDFIWSDPVKMVLPEYGNGDGTFVIFDKQIK
jgi:hypothetical protein